ncbi:SMODS domain-containing nucleotidyltransferase [Bradyrhizobium japonicum]|uniref:SMODS domain-containing nucleotidyltransferase n=1 Tax=Bradyrhizobium japonicum TaxID=375 RepID=UPI00040D27C9|nr:nucleotidyltransferase [Bradyrhizobium japonicum]WLB87724.1 nucleotidyltransferase [Bradyrhizobium japonicum USDA 135]
MKHVDLFKDFLNDVVNLNLTRVTALEDSIEAIKSAVKDSDWAPKIRSWMPQGSWAHKTIIKPVDQGEFDADLLVFVDPVSGWSAETYIEKLYEVFRANGTYKDKVRRWSHCVTITYANDRKIDVAPCVVNRGGFVRLEVCNRNTGEFEATEPVQYTEWLTERNSYSGSNSFRKVTRLIKYLRDIKTTFTCSSVLLTTILGSRINSLDKDSDAFADTPTALKTMFGRLDEWCQLSPTKPNVNNPFLQSENFAESWTDEQYANFRERVNTYRGWIDEAYDEADRNESIAKWRRVFGDDFAKSVDAEDAKSISKMAVARLKESVSTAALFVGDLVEAVKQFGVQALPLGFNKRPYMKAPRWKKAKAGTFTICIKASLYQSKGYNELRRVNSLDPVPKDRWLEVTAVTSAGLPPSKEEYEVQWRVTNTDEDAYNARQLRGDFYASEGGQSRFEELSFRGIHLVEAFVIRKRDNTLVAQSEPFRVLIE